MKGSGEGEAVGREWGEVDVVVGRMCVVFDVTLLALCPVLLMSVPSTSKLISVDMATGFGNLLDL